ncbi:hypothetical protein [Lichenifustis flavocetrariae]|uniref:Uncharacterized protein n=1 Tax=Lichenifustis flavocetrariae TaxID=2949735 RepID=A0AA41YZF8_9HYPH|nr:hypothetical protein [Lichenifustis flavocetrariae]MCW6510959.1 hypothetical protein [Lichenifustis flavocetrariae]
MAADPWAAFQDVAVVDNPPRGAAPDAGGGRPLTVRGGTPAPVTASPGADPWAGFQDVQVAPEKGDAAPQSRGWRDTAGDMATSTAAGIERSAIGAVGLPADAAHYAGKGMSWVMNKARGAAGLDPIPFDENDPTDPSHYIGAGAITKRLEDAAGPIYQPQTRAGRYAESVGEFLPGAMQGGIRSLLKYGVAPGVASEAAGEATQGTAVEPYARMGAAIATGGGAALASRPGTAAGILSEAAGGLDGPTLARAQDLMDAATRQGSPITLAEAVQQVTNSGTRLGAVQRVVEQSRGGADTMAKFYANRPDQVQQAGTAAIDQIGTVPAVPLDGSIGPVYPNTAAIGPGVQRAAQGALDASPQGQASAQALADAGPRVTPEQAGQVIQPALRQTYDERLAARSAQARQDYAAAGPDTVDPSQVQGIIDDLNRQIAADKTGLLAGPLGDLRNRISMQAKPQRPQWEADPAAGGDVGPAPDMPSPPPEAYMDAQTLAPKPDQPRPQSLHQFVRAAGGVRDPGGDLAAMGLDQVPGIVAKPGQGLSPDYMRQAAAQAGYLGPNIDDAMASTTIGDLHDALASERPVHSVHDSAAVDAWNAYDLSRADADQLGRPTGRSAVPLRTPLSAYGDELGAATPGQPSRVPITNVANLNRSRKYFRDRIDLPQIAPRSIDKETAARLGPALGDLDAAMTAGSPAYARANANFAKNSVPLQPFENTPGIARAIEQDPYGSRFLSPADRVPGMIVQGGPEAARAFNSVATSPARKALEDQFTTQILDQATGPSGAVDADRLARTVRDHGDTLRQFPAVQARVQRVIDTQRATEPPRDSQVGRLAATRDFREQAAILLSPNPVPGSARDVGDAVRQVAAQSPDAARALVSQHIRQVFSEATESNMGGPNQWGGAKFNAVIRGNDE